MMLLDDGLVAVYRITEHTNPAGGMPYKTKDLCYNSYFGYRTIGYGRQYAAQGVSQQVDALIRVDTDKATHIGDIAIIDGVQYRVDNVQRITEGNLPYQDLTLSRMDGAYDVGN